jgi:membrane protein DedA with SNARE-associated domain
MLEDIVSWVQDVVVDLGYPGIFVLTILEVIAPPIPSEIILPFAGFLASRDELNFWGVVVAGTAGSLIGAWGLYFVGLWGDERVRWIIHRWGKYVLVSEREVDQAERYFRRYGSIIVLVSRMIPGIRSLISIPAGMARMDLWRFSVFTALGSFGWTLLLVYVGWVLENNWRDIEPIFQRLQLVIVALVAVVVVAYVWYKVRSRRAQQVEADRGANTPNPPVV